MPCILRFVEELQTGEAQKIDQQLQIALQATYQTSRSATTLLNLWGGQPVHMATRYYRCIRQRGTELISYE